MDFTEVLRKRRMVRHFTTEPVAREAIERILAAAIRAPSAGFTQGQSFVVVTEAATKQTIAQLCDEAEYVKNGMDPFISEAPVLLIPCVSELAYHRRYQEADTVDEQGLETVWPVPYWFMDIGCSVMLALLAVVDEGLAAGFAGSHDLAGLRTLLGMPEDVTPVGVIPVGYAAPDKRSPSLKRGRKAQAEFARWERW